MSDEPRPAGLVWHRDLCDVSDALRGESFRLRVDGVPSAPVGNLNKLVAAQSAEEGVIEFVIPAAARAVVLLVRQADESTEIAVDLSSKPRG